MKSKPRWIKAFPLGIFQEDLYPIRVTRPIHRLISAVCLVLGLKNMYIYS